jgi:hypothetical protein
MDGVTPGLLSRMGHCHHQPFRAITSILELTDEQTELPKDRLRPPMQISWQPARQPSPKQENHLRPIISFIPLSPSLGSFAAPNIRRLSLKHNNSWATLEHGGPTSPSLCLPTIKCGGLNSMKHSGPNTFQWALC